jgi:transcription elongation factor GreA
VLGSREIAVATDLDVISPESPIGSAIMGAKKGDKVTYDAPNGKKITVGIVDSEPLK